MYRSPANGLNQAWCVTSAAAAVITTVAICLYLVSPLHACAQPNVSTQAIDNPSSPPLKVKVRLVVIDVVAADATSKPIYDLTAKDFQVFEDGQLQRIRSVEPPSAHSLPMAATAATIFDAANPDHFGHSPVNVLVLDQLNTHFTDSAFARRSLHDYLANQPALLREPTTLLSISEKGLKQVQPFTLDRDSLVRALDGATTEYAWTLETNGKAEHGPIIRLDQSLRALEQMAQDYARIPGRKNLVWVGSGFPTLDAEALGNSELQEVKQTLQHVTDILLDTHVTLYAIDPTSSAVGMSEITNASQMAFVQAAGDALEGGADPFNTNEDFDKLGQVTGGRVVRGRNDVSSLIGRSLDAGANFYTLAYSPTSLSEAVAGFRKIRVACLRAGCSATARSGYYSEKAQQAVATETIAYDLTTAAEATAPLNGLNISVEHATGGDASTYTVHVSASSLNWTFNPDGSAHASVYVLAASIDAKHKMLGHTLHGMLATARPGTDLQGAGRTADFQFTVQPFPKSSTLRFVVRDSATGRMGLVDLPLKSRE